MPRPPAFRYTRRRARGQRTLARAYMAGRYRQNLRGWYRNPAPVAYTRRARGARLAASAAQKRNWRMPKFLLAQIDPFSRDAMHTRVPDESTAPSSSFYTYDELTLSANSTITNGAIANVWLPSVETIGAFANSSSTVSQWTWAAAYGQTFTTAKASAITSQYQLARPVAHGVRITSPLAPTTVTGYLHVGLYSMSTFNQTTWQLPTTLAQLSELPFYKKVTLASLTQTPLVICNKFLDQTAFRYVDVQSTDAVKTAGGQFQSPNSWMVIITVAEGHNQAAGVSVINVENIAHYEAQSAFGGVTQDGPAEPPAPHTVQATAETIAGMSAARQGDDATVNMCLNNAFTQFKNHLYQQVGSAANVISGELGASAGRSTGRYISDAAAAATIGAAGLMTRGIMGVNNVGRLQ